MAKTFPLLSSVSLASFTGAATNYVVETAAGDLYCIYVDNTTVDIFYKKSTDGGVTWAAAVSIAAISATQISVWYDRWSGIAAGLIHLAYTDATSDDTLYRSINTESSDTLSTQTVIFAGASTAAGGALSITRARGGNLYCKSMIDAGAEGGFFRSVDVGANWTARTNSEALATQDQWILMPGWAADTQDIMMFFWDASADEISRCLYDDSGDAWAETSIATTMVDVPASTNYPHWAAAVDITNSRNLLIAWSANDLANADLRCWHVTESTITEVTNVVLNSTDDQGFAALGIDTSTQDWYAFYGGKSSGAETFPLEIHLHYKISTDDGATWGAETAFTPSLLNINSLFCAPRFDGVPAAMFITAVTAYLIGAVEVSAAAASTGISRARAASGF